MHPEPVPTSNILLDEEMFVLFNTSSTISSVSGLGIKTSLLT